LKGFKNGVFIDKWQFIIHIFFIMKETVQIDSAGRLVIPKAFRNRYGFQAGKRIRLIAGDEGVTLVPELPRRRFIKRGPILTIDTGAGIASEDVFSV
jgi:AbrB family looped-hinge helix DNA binding protein